MTKEDILLKNFNYGFTGMEQTAIFKSMEDYAKEVLSYVLTRNHPDYELKGERIVMHEGCFWWISDDDGDDELTEERIIKLYENDTSRKS